MMNDIKIYLIQATLMLLVAGFKFCLCAVNTSGAPNKKDKREL